MHYTIYDNKFNDDRKAQYSVIMKNVFIYALLSITAISGLFYAIYMRQPMGFAVTGAAGLALIYFIIKRNK